MIHIFFVCCFAKFSKPSPQSATQKKQNQKPSSPQSLSFFHNTKKKTPTANDTNKTRHPCGGVDKLNGSLQILIKNDHHAKTA